MKTVVLLVLVAALASVALAQEVAERVIAPEYPDLNRTDTRWVMFKQCDGRWGSYHLGTCSATICQAGCAMSSVAMLLATRGWNGNPYILNRWLTGAGGYADGCGIIWASVDKLGLVNFVGFESPSYDAVCSGVAQGHGVIINVRSGHHWVLVTGCAGGNVFYVNDPGFNQATYTTGDVSHYAVYH